MKLGIYLSPLSSVLKPTGFGRHMASMTAELAAREGVQAVLLAGWAAYGHLAAELPAAIPGELL